MQPRRGRRPSHAYSGRQIDSLRRALLSGGRPRIGEVAWRRLGVLFLNELPHYGAEAGGGLHRCDLTEAQPTTRAPGTGGHLRCPPDLRYSLSTAAQERTWYLRSWSGYRVDHPGRGPRAGG